jgi:predicted metal-dependent hydrolase
MLKLKDVEKILKEKISWILRKQREIREMEKTIEVTKPDFSKTNITLPYLGKNYKVEIKELKEENDSLVFKNERFLFTINNYSRNIEKFSEKIKNMYEDWLYCQAGTIFKNKVNFL